MKEKVAKMHLFVACVSPPNFTRDFWHLNLIIAPTRHHSEI